VPGAGVDQALVREAEAVCFQATFDLIDARPRGPHAVVARADGEHRARDALDRDLRERQGLAVQGPCTELRRRRGVDGGAGHEPDRPVHELGERAGEQQRELAATGRAHHRDARGIHVRRAAEHAHGPGEVLERDVHQLGRETGRPEAGERERGVAAGREHRGGVDHPVAAVRAAEHDGGRPPLSARAA